MRRLFIAVLVIALLGGITYVSYQRFAGPPSAVAGEQVTVKRGEISATVSATGGVEPVRQVTLTFRAPGKIVAIPVQEGQQLATGTVLARLDTTDLQFAVDQAEANLAAAEARLRQLQNPARPGDIAAAEAQVASAEANLQRVKDGPSAGDVAAARANLTAAQETLAKLLRGPDESQLATAKANLARAEAALKQAQAAYDQVKWRSDIGMLPQSLQLQQTTIDYQLASANYESVVAGPGKDQIDQARAQVAQAQTQLDKLSQGPAAADISAAQAQVAQVQAQLDKLKEGADPNEIAAAEASVRQAQVGLDQARNNLAGATITAPFDGTVARIAAKEAELVGAQTPIVTLADLSRFHLDVLVDEVDVGQVKAGDDVTVTLDAFRDQPFLGVIERVAPVADVQQGVVNYPVRITLDTATAPGELRSGMTANATITTERREQVLLVPNRAVEIDRETGDVYVQKLDPASGTTSRMPVTIGLRDDQSSEILSGLQAGDVILIPASNQSEPRRNPFQRGES
ncbi:MAG: efflux RND transporter periplasmic adaptor subunit [Ardenticatenaceae bacterium]|nr:efflux RND transporter periplasmic adaptor subunit [Ardenticatenaceae bacterium]HBY98658.1 hypothetical protein [Chloroflexota bacterium]